MTNKRLTTQYHLLLKRVFVENSRIWIKGGIVAVIVLIAVVWRTQLVQLFLLLGDQDSVVSFLQKYGLWGPIILSIILAVQVFLAVIPGHAFIVAGGFVYGWAVGFLITQISTVFASQVAFALTRTYGRPLVDRLAPPNMIDHWNSLAKKQGIFFFVIAFILPIFPNDLMCFIAGLSAISHRKFFVANFFGRLPCAIFVTLIGSHGFQIPIYVWIVLAILMFVVFLSWRYFSAQIEEKVIDKFSSTSCVC